MVVIGFDPGSISFGVGIIKKEANKVFYLHSEEIKLREKDFFAKMKHLYDRLDHIYASFPIDRAAIEEGFLGKNVKVMNLLARVRGVVMGSLIRQNINLVSYSPRQVKLAMTGSGSALKPQVNKVLRMLLDINDKKLGNDESDALAVAYCHILHLK
ncbi:MAG: crossover junction endodeoxyribonuclease RuvC [Candidatus Aminicenantes bacterium]|nr:crossover junction endodeoxyribonuclease RuvC [Candidatus Aminicenantes bacterium]